MLGLTGAAIRRLSGIGSRKVTVVFGGAPCQGFSLIGARALDDPRNALVREFVRIVTELDADFFVFENVKGITLGKHAMFLRELGEAFAACGYQVRLPWKVLNAVHYGVPQDRERLFLMGCKNYMTLPNYPEQIFREAGTKAGALPHGPSCHDALGDIPDAELYGALLCGDSADVRWGAPSAYARSLRCLSNDAFGFGYRRAWNPGMLTSSARTDHTPVSRQRFLRTRPGAVEAISRFYKLPANGVSNTLRAGTDSARGAFTSPRPIHYEYGRCVTVREMARLHGFPDWFRFHATKWHGARQIGNSVPPPLALAVAAQIMAASGHMPIIPDRILNLGDVALLSMDARAAAKHFGVVATAGKRDKKSAPKRRQWDDEAVAPAEETR